MKRFVIVLAACGPSSTPAPRATTSPPPRATPAALTLPQAPSEPSTQLIGRALCAIREANVTLARPLQLVLHGKPFAQARELTSLDVRAATVGASARIETKDLALVGDIDLKKQPIRPRHALQDGWLGVGFANPGSVSGETMTLDVRIPSNVTPAKNPFFRVPCDALTFSAPPDLPAEGKEVWLKEATKIPLRVDPNGQPVATLETPRIGSRSDTPADNASALLAYELVRSGNLVRIRHGVGASYVEGWIDAAHLGTPQKRGNPVGVGGRNKSLKPKLSAMRCPHEVGIYVRDKDVIRVGTYKKDGLIVRTDERKDEVTVDLGLGPKLPIEPMGGVPDLEPFVRAQALAGCAAQ